MGLSNGSCVKTYASGDILKTNEVGLVTAFALAFVDSGEYRASGFFVQHSPLARFCSYLDGEISTKGFLSVCMYEMAIVNNDCRQIIQP